MDQKTKSTDGVVQLLDGQIGYQIFIWRLDKKQWKLSGVYWEQLLMFATKHGYYRFDSDLDGKGATLVHLDQMLITRVTEQGFQSALLHAIREAYEDGIQFDYQETTIVENREVLVETYLKNSSKFLKDNLNHLDRLPYPICYDQAEHSHLFFSNVVMKITGDGIEPVEQWEPDRGVIWDTWKIDREYFASTQLEKGQFELFIENVCGHDAERVTAMRRALGYLLHNFNGRGNNKAIILLDEAAYSSTISEGGTGKGLIHQAVKQFRKSELTDGKKEETRFMLSAVKEDTQILTFDDISNKFDFKRLYSGLSEGMVVEKKHKDEVHRDKAFSPKVLITSNHTIDESGTSNKRRQCILLLSNFYALLHRTKENPIAAVHKGQIFFSRDWPEDEWRAFDAFMMGCLQAYLAEGLVLLDSPLVKIPPIVAKSTCLEFIAWAKQTDFFNHLDQPGGYTFPTTEAYAEFCAMHPEKAATTKQINFTTWVKKYLHALGYLTQRSRKFQQPVLLIQAKMS